MRLTLLACLVGALAGGGGVNAFVLPTTGLVHVPVLVGSTNLVSPVAACSYWSGSAADATASGTARSSVAHRRHLSTLR